MKENLDDNYWSSRYKSNLTGWDIGDVALPLKTYFEQLNDKSIKILIPGCGNAHEAKYLLDNGFTDVTLIDISEVLVEKLKNELNEYIQKGFCRVIHQDFFEHQSQYDLIIEQTFFCAIDPQLRSQYANKMYELLKPNGKLVGVMFNREFVGGPPFGGTKAEYLTYFEPLFSIKTMDDCYNSIKPRAGSELFVNLVKL